MPARRRAHRAGIPLLWIALIALIPGTVALAFARLAGWMGDRLTAQRFTDTIEATGPAHPGFRRAHSKGICVSGWFEPVRRPAPCPVHGCSRSAACR